jgi:hypothetical protein
MATKSLASKLGIKSGYQLLLLNAPQEYPAQLEPLPEAATIHLAPGGVPAGDAPALYGALYDVVQVFVRNKAEVDRQAQLAKELLKPGGLLWYSYPKKSSKVESDISRDQGWESVNALGLEPVAQVAVDDVWSALRFRPTAEIKARRQP